MASEDAKLGYEFEDEIKGAFKSIQSSTPFYWHQFPDSKAARGMIASQPSDFLVKGLDLPVMLLEAKASVKKKSLASCAKSAILPAQIGHHKKFQRAGGKTLFIFYCELENRVELWDGQYVTDCISDGVRMNVLGGEHLLATGTYFDLEKLLFNYFCK